MTLYFFPFQTTPLWVASFSGKFEVVKILVEHGAIVDAKGKNDVSVC